MNKKELTPGERAKIFFYALERFLQKVDDNKDFVDEEIVNEYNQNLGYLDINLSYLKMRKEDIYGSNGEYIYTKIGFITDTNSTTSTNIQETNKKLYKKSHLVLKLYQVFQVIFGIREDKII